MCLRFPTSLLADSAAATGDRSEGAAEEEEVQQQNGAKSEPGTETPDAAGRAATTGDGDNAAVSNTKTATKLPTNETDATRRRRQRRRQLHEN